MNPSGPGALVDPTSKRAEKISCFEGIAQIESLSFESMQLSKRERRSSSILGIEEVKTFLKCAVKQLPISRLSEDQEPEGSFKKSIAFLLLLMIVEV
jgi:hypothetical protein